MLSFFEVNRGSSFFSVEFIGIEFVNFWGGIGGCGCGRRKMRGGCRVRGRGGGSGRLEG